MKKDEKKLNQPIENKKAHHDYIVLDTLEAGLQLKGWEVKSLRLGRASMKDSHVRFMKNEAYLVNMHITPYQFSRPEEIEETRSRKLLLHKRQLIELQTSADQKGLAIIPLKVYAKKHNFKVLIGLAKGKKIHEKREMIKQRDLARDAAREIRWKDR